MKIDFLFNVPAQHTNSNNPKLFINVEAEVIAAGSANETCFLHNISGKGLSIIWELKASPELFDLVSNHAIALANETLKTKASVVSLAESFYKSENN